MMYMLMLNDVHNIAHVQCMYTHMNVQVEYTPHMNIKYIHTST